MVWLFELFAAAPLVKRKFEDQDNIPAAADNAADNAAADAAPTPASAADPPATPPDRGASLGPTQDPSPAGKGGKGAKPAGAGKKGGKGQGWCRLNLWAWTWVGSSQSQVTGK